MYWLKATVFQLLEFHSLKTRHRTRTTFFDLLDSDVEYSKMELKEKEVRNKTVYLVFVLSHKILYNTVRIWIE